MKHAKGRLTVPRRQQRLSTEAVNNRAIARAKEKLGQEEILDTPQPSIDLISPLERLFWIRTTKMPSRVSA